MKKFLLMLVAAMVTVTSFAQLKQRMQVSSFEQLAKPSSERTITPMKYTGKIQSQQLRKHSSARRALASASDLEGEYIACSYQYYTEQDETTGKTKLVPDTISRKGISARIEATGANTINIYGINSNAYYEDSPISATVDLETGTITIVAGQTIWSHDTYGDFTMFNMEGDTGAEPFTGTIGDDGSVAIDQLWAEAYGEGDNFGINGNINLTFLVPVNGTMSYTADEYDDKGAKTGNRIEVVQNCFIEQSEDAKKVTVWNFHNFSLGEVVDINVQSDKTFSIAGGEQAVYNHSSLGYIYLWGFDGQYIDDISGTVSETQLKSALGLAYINASYRGYTYPQDLFTIDLTDGSTFALPQAETGELVTLPEGLTPVSYPFSYSIYVGGERVDQTGTAKVAKSGNDIYFQGLDILIPEAWVKGTLDTEKGTVSIPVTYTGATEGTPHFFAGYSSNGPKALTLDYDADADTYSYSATIMIYKGSETTTYLYYYNGLFLGTKPVPTTAPEGLVTEDMPFKGNYRKENATEAEEVAGTVKVGRAGNDLYVQGLFADKIPGNWLKGTFTTIQNEQYVVFSMNQYVGDLSNGLSAYLTGYMSGGDGAEGTVSDVYFLYNAEGNYYKAVNPVILTRFKSSTNYTSFYQTGLTIGNAPETAISNIKDVKSDNNAWYNLNGVRVAQPTQKGLYIHNGKKFVIK